MFPCLCQANGDPKEPPQPRIVIFIIKENSGKYLEIESSEDNPVLVEVPKNRSSAHINLSNEPSIILALVNPSWKPDNRDEHNVSYDDYNWKKWDITKK